MSHKKLNLYSSLAIGIAIAINSSTPFAHEPITPIEHVIVIIGENVSFDTLYGAYTPLKAKR